MDVLDALILPTALNILLILNIVASRAQASRPDSFLFIFSTVARGFTWMFLICVSPFLAVAPILPLHSSMIRVSHMLMPIYSVLPNILMNGRVSESA